MSEDIFQTLQDELTADTDAAGVPSSAWFWDDALSRVAENYTNGSVPSHSHLEMRAAASQTVPTGSAVTISPTVNSFDVVNHDSEDDTSPLIGKSTSSDMSVMPLTLQVVGNDQAFIIPSWIGVTRGGQRWVRLGANTQRQLLNLDDLPPEREPDPLLQSLEFASRIQQVHMGVDLPDPDFSPLDMVTTVAVSQAAMHTAPDPGTPNSFSAAASRALKAQLIMRIACVRTLLNVSHICPDSLPLDALVRLDALSDQADHLGCGAPSHSSRLLSAGTTEVLNWSLNVLADVDWDDVDAADLTGVVDMTDEEARWWGGRGIATVCKHRTGGVNQVWADLSAQVGPFLNSILSDASRAGLSSPYGP